MATKTNSPRVLIAASGSGGHLLPALIIAQAFKTRLPDAQIEFVGSGRPLEEIIIGRNGFKCQVISASGLKNRGLKGALEFVFSLPSGIVATWKLLNAFKPDVIVGAGGYATFLPITLGFARGIPTWIHEAELKPGLANSFLSLIASKTSIAFEHARMPFWARAQFTGHPVRPEIAAIAKEGSQVISPKKLLIMGGSQGAKAIDDAMVALSPYLREHGISIWHQCRKENLELVNAGYKSLNVEAKVESFIEKPQDAYRWADLVVCRSGAGTVMEIGLINRPTIFVPYPFAQGNHQLANAKTLADFGKALIVEEGADFQARLKNSLDKLLSDSSYQQMKNGPFVTRSAGAANSIVEGCLGLIGQNLT
jgi:UDP-N-acetylglucosamine--N-acetylmuramyl-(pentapeptide) pyrophosphoryl-undecaprenol N-acetylglucosamine transferase